LNGVDVLELEFFLVQNGLGAEARIFPSRNVAETLVIA
jgi:hypothetical protein